MPSALSNFGSIWCIVVAVETRPGECLEPIAIAAMDLSSTAVVQVGMPKLRGVRRPPYPTGPLTLIVTIDAQLLAGCHLALGWLPMYDLAPGANTLDPHEVPQPRVTLIDLKDGTASPRTLVAPRGYVGPLAFAPDGKTLALGGLGAVHLFDLTRE